MTLAHNILRRKALAARTTMYRGRRPADCMSSGHTTTHRQTHQKATFRTHSPPVTVQSLVAKVVARKDQREGDGA